MQDLLNALESAAKTLIDAEETGYACFTGQAQETQVRPSVTVYASGGEEQTPIGAGNFRVTIAVTVRSKASDTSIGDHREKVRDIFGVFTDEDFTTAINTLGTLTVFDAKQSNKRSREDKEDGSWLSEFQMDLYCCLEVIA